MKKKIISLFFVVIMVWGLTACGDSDAKKYAIIENNTSEADKLCTESAWEGVQQFASENDGNAARYTPEGDKRKDYTNAIEEAIDEGAEIIICVGDEMSVPVYEAQNNHRRVNFVLLNAEPHKRYSEKSNIAENTIALQFDPVAEGYLAGYVAVANGARDIGCMGGAETSESLAEASGFIQGAEAAAKELGLAEDTVKIRYTFTGFDKVSPAYMGKAMDWYNSGCEVIFVPNENVRTSVIPAAESLEKQIIGIGKSSMEESECVLTAAYINYSGAVYLQMQSVKNNTFTGEQSILCGAKENGVAVVVENTGLSDSTVVQYQAIYQKLANNMVTLDKETGMPSTTLVTVEKE